MRGQPGYFTPVLNKQNAVGFQLDDKERGYQGSTPGSTSNEKTEAKKQS